MSRLRSLVLVAAAAACGEPVSPHGNPVTNTSGNPLVVSLSVNPHVVVPGQHTTATAAATLPDTLRLQTFALALHWLGADTTLFLPVRTVGSVAFNVVLTVPVGPFEGVLGMTAIARLGQDTDSARDSVIVQDDGPPRLQLTVPQAVEPAESLAVDYSAQDSAGIDSLVIRLGGAIQQEQVITAPTQSQVSGTLKAWVPMAVPLGDSVSVSALVRDGFGKLRSAAGQARVRDTTMPVLTSATVDSVCHAGVDCGFFPYAFFPGDTVRIRITARDNRALAWIGYRMLQFGDSVAPGSTVDSASYQLILPPGTNAADAPIALSAVDSSGNRAFAQVWANVMDGTVRATQSIADSEPPDGGSQNPYVLDPKRDVLYYERFTFYGWQLKAVALNPLSALPPIDFGAGHFLRGLDLTPDGDSLVVVILGRPNLLVKWDIASGPSTADTIPLTSLGDCDAWNVQVAANDHAFVSGWSQAGCPVLVDVDLRTGSQQATPLPGSLEAITRSGDHRIILAWDGARAAVYNSAVAAWGPVRTLFPDGTWDPLSPDPALDDDGSAILIRNRLYNADLTTYRSTLPEPKSAPPIVSLSADGQTAFAGSWPGYWRVDAATGAVTEKVILPRGPGIVIAHPDGQRLIVSNWRWVGVVDLR